MGKELTEEEVRRKFLDHVRSTVSYWENVKDQDRDLRGRLEGLAFSILVLLDGAAVGMPSFIVAPRPHETDKAYSQEEGSDWFPENHDSNVRCNISGSLHDEFYNPR